MGRLKNIAKRIVFSALTRPALLHRRLRQSAHTGRVTILNFHRVAPYDGSSYPPLDPLLFDDVMSFCSQHFEIVTFSDLAGRPAGARPRAVISFDDGYRDFVEYALPILRRHGMRANHNFIVSSLRSGLPPPNVLLQDFIGKANDCSVRALAAVLGMSFDTRNGRVAFGMQVSNAIKYLPIASQKEILARARQAVEIDRDATPMMSMADARAIAREIEVGAHSLEHANLLVESDDYIANDARHCRAFFDTEIRAPTSIYALPNGMGEQRVYDILETAGFNTILLTGERFAQPGARNLPRFSMGGSSRPELHFRAVGFVRQ